MLIVLIEALGYGDSDIRCQGKGDKCHWQGAISPGRRLKGGQMLQIRLGQTSVSGQSMQAGLVL